MSGRHRTETHRRFLSMETLEARRLLVVGIVPSELPPQNFADPEDANYDGTVSPADALIVINQLNSPGQNGSPKPYSTDVDGDGVVSPRDALLIINRLNSRSETSSVPPQQRAIGLRHALDAGYVPPNMSLSDAQVMLETLQNGGHYEAGYRYRNGEMINIDQPPLESGDPAAAIEGDAPTADQPVDDAATDNPATEPAAPREVDEDDPFAVFESADETLADPLHDATLWHAFGDSSDASGADDVDHLTIEFSEEIAERSDARESLAQAVTDGMPSGDQALEDIHEQLLVLRATLGDTQSQIAQLFASMDLKRIVQQLEVDLGTLAEAVVSHGQATSSERETVFADFLGREYLPDAAAILP